MKDIDFGAISIPVDQYASQGNAALGIRGSGKSYTATYVAERLDEAGIPFTAFDPIGIWRYLRVPAKTNGKGYKIVVAGGEHGDIPLPAHGAAEIMRAAMKEGVSIVFDLYDISLSKNDWRRVVESALKVLLYENKAHGLRHVFLEEAAEFCPQRLPPGDSGTSAVYSMVERLARMGGNAQLGYTLINQRAEEVNKSVLELCDLLILHRQKGRNSLTALGKWLDVARAKGKIADEVPALANGEAFIWPAGDEPPVKTKIPAKRSFHPDRKAMQKGVVVEAKSADVSAFVTTMRASLEHLTREAEENDPKRLRAANAKLEAELAKLRKSASSPAAAQPVADTRATQQVQQQLRETRKALERAMKIIATIRTVGFPDKVDPKKLEAAIAAAVEKIGAQINAELAGQLRALQKLQAEGESLITSVQRLLSDEPQPIEVTVRHNEPFSVQAKAAREPAAPRPASRPAPDGVGSGEMRVLAAIAQHARGVTREQLTVLTGYKRSSRDTYLQRLAQRGFIATGGSITATPAGLEALGPDFEPLPTGAALRKHWLEELPEGERRVLEVVLDAWPGPCDRDRISEVTEYKRSSRDTYLQRLAARQLIVTDRGTVRASRTLFD